ncbi:MAG: V-type ATPase subunit [archaeon]
MEKQISYKFNPYTFARICAMKSLLLKKEDYDRIMKRDVNEIIKLLQEGVYGEEINALGLKYKGAELLENALNKHLSKIFSRLRIVADPNTGALMDQYLKRYDFFNLKTLLRAKQTRIASEDILDYLLPVGFLDAKTLKSLYDKDSLKEIMEHSKLVNLTDYRDALARYDENNDLAEIENLLDYHYYLDTVEFAKSIPDNGKLFREFFFYEFDTYNLKLVLKKLHFKLDKENVKKFVINAGKELAPSFINSLLDLDNMQDFLKEINKTSYRKIFSESQTQLPLLKFEVLLESMLLWKRILLYHKNLLSVDVVLGYMFAKEIEVKNLRVIVKSKALELTEDYIKNLIVIR